VTACTRNSGVVTPVHAATTHEYPGRKLLSSKRQPHQEWAQEVGFGGGRGAVDDRATRLEATVEQLRVAVLSLERRLEALEEKRPEVTASKADAPKEEQEEGLAEAVAADATTVGPYDPIAIVSLVGRLMLVIAGGFFLRAMTDAGVLVPRVGLALGFVYALAWLFFADRAGGRQRVPAAVFHAMATAMIAFPLLVEATTRFKVLTGAGSVAGMAVLTTGLLFVAWHHRMRAVVWIAVIGALPTSFWLLIQTGNVPPFAFYLVAFGLATLWLSYALGWWGVRWPVALAADVAVVGATLRVLAPENQDAPHLAILLQLLLLGTYLASIGIRTLVRGRSVGAFEVAQTFVALLVGFGGALYLTRATGIPPGTLGAISIVLGAACYGVAVVAIDRQEDSWRNVYFYTSLGLVLVLTGFTLVLGGGLVSVAFAVLAVLTTGLWSRFGRLFALLHGAAYLVAAGIASGVLGYCMRVLAAGALGPWGQPNAAMHVVLVAGGLVAWLAAAQPDRGRDNIASGARCVIILVFLGAVGGLVIGYIASAAGVQAGGGVDSGLLATISTVVLSVATLLFAWLGRRARFREWGWLVYPLLVVIGLKMLGQDFKYSRPATLFIAMALYGAALILAPRLRRRGDSAAIDPVP
jgi:hypothetical protein